MSFPCVQGCHPSGRSFRGGSPTAVALYLPRSQSVRSRVELLDAAVREVADRSTQLTADLSADHVGALTTRRSRSTCRSHWFRWFQLINVWVTAILSFAMESERNTVPKLSF